MPIGQASVAREPAKAKCGASKTNKVWSFNHKQGVVLQRYRHACLRGTADTPVSERPTSYACQPVSERHTSYACVSEPSDAWAPEDCYCLRMRAAYIHAHHAATGHGCPYVHAHHALTSRRGRVQTAQDRLKTGGRQHSSARGRRPPWTCTPDASRHSTGHQQ